MQKKIKFIFMCSVIICAISCSTPNNNKELDEKKEEEKAEILDIKQKDYTQILEFNAVDNIHGLLVKKEKSKIIRLAIGFKNAGYLYDPKDKQGLSELASIALTKSNSSKKNASQIDEIIDGYASTAEFTSGTYMMNLNIFSMKEYFADTLNEIIEKIINIEISDEELESYKKELKTINTYKENNPSSILTTTVINTIYKDHPLSQSQTGNIHTLEKINAEDVLQFISEKFTRDSIIISIVGDVDEQVISTMIKNTLTSLPQTNKNNTKNNTYNSPIIRDISKPIEGYSYSPITINFIPQNFIIFAYNGRDSVIYDATNSEKNKKNNSINMLLSFILNDIFFKEIREKNELVYSIFTQLTDYRYSELLTIFFGTNHNTSEKTKLEVKKSIEKLLKNGISKEVLDKAKINVVNKQLIALNSPSNMLQFLQKIQFDKTYTSIYTITEHLNILKKITLEDLNNKLEEIFYNNNYAIFEIGKIDEDIQEINFKQNFKQITDVEEKNKKESQENLTSISTSSIL